MSTFRQAMARLASGVTLVTANDETGASHGLTASSFCSVSAEPPLVLVCVDRSANSFPVFATCTRFAVSILQPHHVDLAKRFATKGIDKFADITLDTTAAGIPVADGALCVLECSTAQRYDAGDHVILLGAVDSARVNEGRPMVYFDRGFHELTS